MRFIYPYVPMHYESPYERMSISELRTCALKSKNEYVASNCIRAIGRVAHKLNTPDSAGQAHNAIIAIARHANRVDVYKQACTTVKGIGLKQAQPSFAVNALWILASNADNQHVYKTAIACIQGVGLKSAADSNHAIQKISELTIAGHNSWIHMDAIESIYRLALAQKNSWQAAIYQIEKIASAEGIYYVPGSCIKHIHEIEKNIPASSLAAMNAVRNIALRNTERKVKTDALLVLGDMAVRNPKHYGTAIAHLQEVATNSRSFHSYCLAADYIAFAGGHSLRASRNAITALRAMAFQARHTDFYIAVMQNMRKRANDHPEIRKMIENAFSDFVKTSKSRQVERVAIGFKKTKPAYKNTIRYPFEDHAEEMEIRQRFLDALEGRQKMPTEKEPSEAYNKIVDWLGEDPRSTHRKERPSPSSPKPPQP